MSLQVTAEFAAVVSKSEAEIVGIGTDLGDRLTHVRCARCCFLGTVCLFLVPIQVGADFAAYVSKSEADIAAIKLVGKLVRCVYGGWYLTAVVYRTSKFFPLSSGVLMYTLSKILSATALTKMDCWSSRSSGLRPRQRRVSVCICVYLSLFVADPLLRAGEPLMAVWHTDFVREYVAEKLSVCLAR